jgi:hypothetical protein
MTSPSEKKRKEKSGKRQKTAARDLFSDFMDGPKQEEKNLSEEN